jgi:hypothetical protein
MVHEDGEVAHFQHVAEMLQGLVDSQQLSIVGTVFLLGRLELLGKECEGLPGVIDTLLQHGPMAEVEATVTNASSAAGPVGASRVASNKLALHSSKALWRCGIQDIG